MPDKVQSKSKTGSALKWSADAWFNVLLAGLILILYGSAVRFGLIWDDPTWYQQGAGRSAWQIFTSLNTSQFYRPLAILLNRQLVSPAGVLNVPLAHALQIGAHLVATLLSVPVLRALKFNPRPARLAALIFAVYPFSYQAVAWPGPQQAFAMMWILLAVWAAHGYMRRGRVVFLALSCATYAAALLFQENALTFVFLFFWLAGAEREGASGRRWRAWPLLHLALALLYAVTWLRVPRLSGVTGTGFQFVVLTYLLQGVAFLPAHLAAGWISGWPTVMLFILFALIGLGLAFAAWKSLGRGPALLNCVWIGAGLLPPWAGLSWGYAQLGPRLMYPAALGVACLWAALAVWAFSQTRSWLRLLGWALLALLLGVSLQEWVQFQTLYQVATGHLAEAVQVLTQAPEGHVLFVNFPDRIDIQPAPYPLGVWGIVLAPVIQNLSDYAHAERGTSAEDRSRAAFLVGGVERAAWPYRVAMRGTDSDPSALFDQTRWADQVYLSDYQPGGLLRLRAVGHIRPGFSASPPLARLGDGVELAGAELSEDTRLTLTWRVLKLLHAEDTIFVHFWKDGAFVAAQDGDSLAGLMPPVTWQPRTEVVDIRPVEADGLGPGHYEVRVGLYNRQDGARFPASSIDGDRYANDEIPVGTLIVP